MIKNKMGSIFTFTDYRAYLGARIRQHENRGLMSAMARACRCQPAHISMILNGKNTLSQDQAFLLAKFLALGRRELTYFLLLVQRERAATAELRDHLDAQLALQRKAALTVSARIEKRNEMSAEFAATYYSAWEYSAVHILSTIPSRARAKEMARYLGISPERVEAALEFLSSHGLIERKADAVRALQSQVHVPHDSPYVPYHHLNWRLRAVEDSRKRTTATHYTSVSSISERDYLTLQDRILDFIKETKALVRESHEEKLACFCLDFFEV